MTTKTDAVFSEIHRCKHGVAGDDCFECYPHGYGNPDHSYDNSHLKTDDTSDERETDHEHETLIRFKIRFNCAHDGEMFDLDDAKFLLNLLDKERQAAKVLEDALLYLESEIIRGKDKDCIGCINGSDIPTETLCRACWRIWIGKEGYLLWDWKTSEMKINEALKLAKQIREGLK